MQSCATAKVQKILLTSQAKTSLDKGFWRNEWATGVFHQFCGWCSENSCKEKQRKYSIYMENDETLPACVGKTSSSHRNVGILRKTLRLGQLITAIQLDKKKTELSQWKLDGYTGSLTPQIMLMETSVFLEADLPPASSLWNERS